MGAGGADSDFEQVENAEVRNHSVDGFSGAIHEGELPVRWTQAGHEAVELGESGHEKSPVKTMF
ncbi:hypothetical protein RBSH_00192 [Rhodopirellula baltica SH28]|uniref:Uncharacterized protein n=1 Tax=Rhodopirellula baltica SH28 TaxID=993517 RepID=K5DCV5_RHOBT|nr:hypothetical protein RBSH_00192 [Rhodopirellula baltica SH28]